MQLRNSTTESDRNLKDALPHPPLCDTTKLMRAHPWLAVVVFWACSPAVPKQPMKSSTMSGVNTATVASAPVPAQTEPGPSPQPTQPTSPPVQDTSCPSGMQWIAGGSFLMGSEQGDGDEKPVHRVELDGFCLDETPVTVGEYARCSGCTKPNTGKDCNWGILGRGNHPVNCVDWNQATAYCRLVGKQLPTEAQWEYAARGGARQLEYPWGSEQPQGRACWSRTEGTCAVGTYPSGAFTLKDMAGNVWEWLQDWYGPYPRSATKNHVHESYGSSRVCRGGSWNYHFPSGLRGSDRIFVTPVSRYNSLGFRCAKAK